METTAYPPRPIYVTHAAFPDGSYRTLTGRLPNSYEWAAQTPQGITFHATHASACAASSADHVVRVDKTQQNPAGGA